MIEASRSLSRAKRVLAESLDQFQFDILGTSLTDDEVIISNSLKEFARYISQVRRYKPNRKIALDKIDLDVVFAVLAIIIHSIQS